MNTSAGEAARRPAVVSAFRPRRGRPTPSQVAAIEQVILDTARTEFLDNGYAATSMEAVAARANVAKGTIYARYAGKEALFDAVVSDRLAVWHRQHDVTSAAPDPDIAATLTRVGIVFLRRMRDPEIAALHRLIIVEAPRFPVLARRFHDIGIRAMVDRLAAILIRPDSDDGPAPPLGAGAVAHGFVAALIGWLDTETLRRPPDDDDCAVFVARLTAIFTAGRAGW